MNARPILFSGPMIRALRERRKQQTRRVSGLDVINVDPGRYRFLGFTPGPGTYHAAFHDNMSGAQVLVKVPYGRPDDLLWVRESCWLRPERTPRMMREGADTWPRVAYHADPYEDADWYKEHRWLSRPSIHMPRWASRLTLRLTDVRVQRLQEISEADAIAEGIERNGEWWRNYAMRDAPEAGFKFAAGSFWSLWDSINAARGYGFVRNPWVWALSFDVINANVDEVLRKAA